jgi:hypothetical protein
MARVLQGRGRSAPGQQSVSGLGLALLLPVVALGWESGEPLTRARPISARGGTTTSMGASKADEYIAAYRASDIPSGKKSELMERLDLLSSSSDAAAAAIMEDGGSAVGIHRWPRFTPGRRQKLTALQATTSGSDQAVLDDAYSTFNSQPKLKMPVKVTDANDKAPTIPGSSISASTFDEAFSGDFMATAAEVGEAAYTKVARFGAETQALIGSSEQLIGMKGSSRRENYERTIKTSLLKIEDDMMMLDRVVGSKAQLSGTEFSVLAGMVATAGLCPFFLPMKLVEFIVPSAAALCAAVGLSSEFVGKVAMANGKEIASVTIQAAAEAEGLLSRAERAKAIIPLCVGISTTAAAFSLLAPGLLEGVQARFGVQLVTEIYLLFPLIGILSGSVAGLAFQETRNMCGQAIGVGTVSVLSSSDLLLIYLFIYLFTFS